MFTVEGKGSKMSFTNSFLKIPIMDKINLPLRKDRKKIRKVGKGQGAFDHISDTVIMETYKAANFNKSETARTLGMSRSTLNIRINDSVELQDMLIDAREEVLDIAESGLLAHVRKGNLNAIKFLLERQGRTRGYGMNVEINNKSSLEALDIGEEMTIEEASKMYADTLVEENMSADDL